MDASAPFTITLPHKKRRNKVVAIAAAIVVMVAGILFALTHADTAATNLGISIPGNRVMYESQQALDDDMSKVQATGVQWMRFSIPWQDIEPQKGIYNWSNVDRVVSSARAHGLNVLGVPVTVPVWNRPAGATYSYGPQTDAERQAFAKFAADAATRYAGRIDNWEIWNEPNLNGSWTSPNVSQYAALLRVTYPAIHQAAANANVIAGGTGWPGGSPEITTVDWYNGLYANGAKNYFDATAIHPYSAFDNIAGGEMANASRVRTIMNNNGDSRKLIWGTETGAPTAGDYSITEDAQATMVAQGNDYWNTITNHGPLFWYTLIDAGGTDREGHFGLLREDGSTKPAYDRLKQYIVNSMPAPDTTAPSMPTGLVASSVTATSVQLTWSAATDNVGVAGYIVRRGSSEVARVSSPAYTDTGLATSTSYTYTVEAYDAAGNVSPRSGSVSAKTLAPPDTTPPSVPTNVNANATWDGKIQLNWQAATDNIGVKDYSIYRDGTPYGVSSTASFTDTSVQPDKTYRYRIAARDAAGNVGPQSSEVTAIVPLNTPGPGLRATYFPNRDLSGQGITRTDATINYSWGLASPMPGQIPSDMFSVRWTGGITPTTSAQYTFYTQSDDGMRLWINDRLVIDDWSDHAVQEKQGTISLTKNVRYNIKVEYYDNTSAATAKLLWSNPSMPKAIVQTSYLTSSSYGLSAKYFRDTTLTALAATRIDGPINFSWIGAPFTGVPADRYSVRWTGRLTVPKTDTYTLYAKVDDGVHLWVDGTLLINQWKDQPATTYSAKISLATGTRHTIEMEFYDDTSTGVAKLSWSSPSISKQVIPKTALSDL